MCVHKFRHVSTINMFIGSRILCKETDTETDIAKSNTMLNDTVKCTVHYDMSWNIYGAALIPDPRIDSRLPNCQKDADCTNDLMKIFTHK